MRPWSALLLAALLLAPLRPALALTETWQLGAIELPPVISVKAPQQGYYALLLRRVLQEAGAEARFVFLPPQRAYQDAVDGRLDGVLPYKRTADRERQFWFSEPFYMAKVRVFLRTDDDWEPAGVPDLRSQTGCSLHSAQAPAELQSEVDAFRVPLQRVSQIEACFRMLHAGRVRFVVAGQHTGWAAAQALRGEGLRLRAANFVLAEQPVHLALSRSVTGNERRLRVFNEALRKLRAQGVLQQMEQRYGPRPPPLE